VNRLAVVEARSSLPISPHQFRVATNGCAHRRTARPNYLLHPVESFLEQFEIGSVESLGKGSRDCLEYTPPKKKLGFTISLDLLQQTDNATDALRSKQRVVGHRAR
jgi:hypothetical protein